MLVKTRNMKRNVLFFADTSSATRFKNPYQDLNIENIITPLDGKFKYSPKFKNALVTTTIKLTGSRRKDYLDAEKKSNCIHIPKKTAWHHVWEKNPNGEYTIQLIDYKLHQKRSRMRVAAKCGQLRPAINIGCIGENLRTVKYTLTLI